MLRMIVNLLTVYYFIIFGTSYIINMFMAYQLRSQLPPKLDNGLRIYNFSDEINTLQLTIKDRGVWGHLLTFHRCRWQSVALQYLQNQSYRFTPWLLDNVDCHLSQILLPYYLQTNFGDHNKCKHVELIDWTFVRSVFNREEIGDLLFANCNDLISVS